MPIDKSSHQVFIQPRHAFRPETEYSAEKLHQLFGEHVRPRHAISAWATFPFRAIIHRRLGHRCFSLAPPPIGLDRPVYSKKCLAPHVFDIHKTSSIHAGSRRMTGMSILPRRNLTLAGALADG